MPCHGQSPLGRFFPVNSIRAAINTARTEGRNGKGCIVVASAGNYYPTIRSVAFPASINGVISVGSIDRYGDISEFSQRGDSLDLVAFGEDVTTLSRAHGYGIIDEKYRFDASGTSYSCPMVSGVAALMLSANPELTESQVYNTLVSTARDLGAVGRDTIYGYGLVDAYAAVDAVRIKITGPTIPGSIAGYVVENLPVECTVTWSWELEDDDNLTIYPFPGNASQCIIMNHYGNYIDNTLIASIRKNGVEIFSARKRIWTGQNFSCTFNVEPMTSPYYNSSAPLSGQIHDGESIDTGLSGCVELVSDCFVGATLTYDDSMANLEQSNDTVRITKLLSSPLNPIPPAFYYPRESKMTVEGTYSNSYEAFRFEITTVELIGASLNNSLLSIDYSENIVTIQNK